MSDIKPWKRLRRGQPLDFKVFTARKDVFEDPRTRAEHPRAVIESVDWVNVVAYTRANEAILIRQFRTGTETVELEIPGGMVDPGEEPEAAAARELEEETGYVAARLEPLGWAYPNPAVQTNRIHCFLALDCDKRHEGQQDTGEDIAVELVPADHLPELVRAGRIRHALVLVAFYLERLLESVREERKKER